VALLSVARLMIPGDLISHEYINWRGIGLRFDPLVLQHKEKRVTFYNTNPVNRFHHNGYRDSKPPLPESSAYWRWRQRFPPARRLSARSR